MTNSVLVFDVEERNGIHMVHMAGPLDSMTFDQGKAFLDSMVQSFTHIILDCRNLTYINSKGLTLLMHYQRRAKLNFCFFGLAGLSKRARKGIELLGLERNMTSYSTMDEALAMAEAI